MSAPEGWEAWHAALHERVAALDVTTLDAGTQRRAALVIVDDLAAMAAAVAEPQVVALAKAAQRVAPQPEATTVTGARAGRGWAALVNAVAANWNELDEGYRPATCHGGLYALPAAMAEVEAAGGTLGELMVALVAGYEVATAYARAFPPPRPLVLHPHATLSPVGAAAAVAKARGASGPGVMAASELAITLAAAGPFAHATSGVLARNGWAGHGALTGFTAVELAAAGVVGDDLAPVTVLHDALGNPAAPAELSASPRQWAIHDGYHKQYACCQYAHSAVEACLELTAGPLRDVPVDDISGIVVETHALAMSMVDAEPTTVLGGKFSVPHSVSAVIAGRSASADTFGPDRLHDPRVERLRGLVEVVPYVGDLTPPFDRPARVTVRTSDGREFSAECRSAVGGPDRPLSEADVLEKAELLTAARFPRYAALAARLVAGEVSLSESWSEVLKELWSQ